MRMVYWKERESVAVRYWTAHAVAELVAAVNRNATGGVEDVPALQNVIAVVVPKAAVKLVAAGLGDDADLRADVAALLRGEVVGDHADFGHGFHIRRHLG